MRRLGEMPGLARIRLVTNHAAYLDEPLIAALAEVPTAMPFLPVPAQHGSDPILREMRRGYTTDLYRRRIDLLRSRVPGIELSSDWIVGFPGESDEDLEKSCDFLREMGFAQNFIFKYSPRPDTAAFDRPTLDDDVVSRRHARLTAVADEVRPRAGGDSWDRRARFSSRSPPRAMATPWAHAGESRSHISGGAVARRGDRRRANRFRIRPRRARVRA